MRVLSKSRHWCLLGAFIFIAGCLSPDPEPIRESQRQPTTVKMDFYAKPLPEIPLPNDIATRFDPDSPTKRRLNASMVAPTSFEIEARTLVDQLDGWGVGQPITIPFTGPLSVESIKAGHSDPNYDPSNDVVYLIDITPGSPDEGQLHTLDIGEGNYPVVLKRNEYWKNDPRGWTLSLFFEEADEDLDQDGILDPGEDLNGNGVLDPGEDVNGNGELDPPEDTDADGILDKPNYLPGLTPDQDDLAGRADALMYFYERETFTLIAQPLEPLRERTTYAVVVMKRLLDADGEPVGSPYPGINHASQTEALKNLGQYMPEGQSLDDVAFAFSFTTQTVESDFIAIRDGLYGIGVQKHLGEDFPARVKEFFPLIDTEHPYFSDLPSDKLLFGEDFASVYRTVASVFQGREGEAFRLGVRGHYFIDFHAIGQFEAPQLFPREDKHGNPLSYNEQVWPQDLTIKKVPARSENIPFWIAVPRKEVSTRGDGKPAPVVIMSHGYGSNRFTEVAGFSSFFAQHGLATIGIECPSHGLGIKASEQELAESLLVPQGVGPFGQAALRDRAFDQNNDGIVDSGADFWTAYVFHTRDILRQCAVDHLALVRLLNSFDGERRWDFDLNNDGVKDLAGDFDGDGVVDVGRGSTINMAGGSLGGIMATILGGMEPSISAITPIAGGGGLGNIGARSQQGGVREAVILRILAPIFTGQIEENGSFTLETIVPNLNGTATLPLAQVENVKPGDTMVVTNLDNGERGCGYVSSDGTVRTGLPADTRNPANLTAFVARASGLVSTEESHSEGLPCTTECPLLAMRVESACGKPLMPYTCELYCEGRETSPHLSVETIATAVDMDGSLCMALMHADRVKVDFYAGPKLVTGSEECEVQGGSIPFASIDRFGQDIVYQEKTFRAGQPLVALEQGKGEARATPGLRRFLGLGQLVLDPSDPAVFARHFSKEPLYYPGTDETTGTHAVVVTTIGDMSVPASSGIHVGRSAGFIDYKTPNPRYENTEYEGLPTNEILIRTYVSEAVNLLGRFMDDEVPIHLDVENYSQGQDVYGDRVPRLDPPLRLVETDPLNGLSGSIFPMSSASGEHGFAMPGEQTDVRISRCLAACPEGEDCGCWTAEYFDIGIFMVNVLGRYLSSGGTKWSADLCNGLGTCDDIADFPPLRRRQGSADDIIERTAPDLSEEDGMGGDAGDNGMGGDAGDNGMSGDAGDNGMGGDAGDNGMGGDAGDNGMGGDAGDNGMGGDAGDNGMGGDAGDNGMGGDAGDNGMGGDAGDNGMGGDAGDNGMGGDAGDNGMGGDAGDNGMGGDAGDNGMSGDAGDNGMGGDVGDNGVGGDAGDNGMGGEAGDNGMGGDAGDNGMGGDAGDNGMGGDAGDNGMGGDAGDNGMGGDAGDNGMGGDAGDNGMGGDAGDNGMGGDAGDNGMGGDAGDNGMGGDAGGASQ